MLMLELTLTPESISTAVAILTVTMKSFVATLACLAMANAGVVLPAGGYAHAGSYAHPGAYAGYGYAGAAGYAAAPAVAYGGVYAGHYDPSVAYANLYPAAEPYVDVQVPAEPYIHQEIPAEPYVDVQTPAELAQIHSLSEFPVPENIKKFLTSERKADNTKKEPKKRRHSVTEPEGPPEPFSLYSTLPRSMRETKLVTNVKVEEDEEVLRARQELVQTRTPAQLSAITSISDLPVPSKLTKMMGSRESSAHGPRPASSVGGEKQTSRTPSKMNVNDMYSTLPKSLTMELAVKTKINDPAVVEERRKLTAEHSPMELGNIGSLADFPIPTPISNLFNKPAADTPEKPKRKKNMEEKRKRNLTTGTFLSSDFLPQSWLDTKLVCRTKGEEDPEVLAKRQEIVAGKSVSELSKMSGIDDFPLPTRVETLVRKKRVLKSTDEKENVKKGVSRSVTSLSAKSLTSLSIPESLLTPLAVKSVVEDQDVVAKNKEIIKTKSVGELAHIGGLSDFPIPDNVENLYNKLTATSSKRPAPAAPIERPTSPQSFKETIYETLPRSMRETQLITNSKFEEDEERLKERQELTRTKSPTELSQISSVSDFPLPTPVENLLKKKSEQPDTASPPVPPRGQKKEGIYDSIPASLKSELIVKSVEQDQELVAERQETIRTHTPAQLSEIHSLADVPIPSFIQNLTASKKNVAEPTIEKPKVDTEDKEKVSFKIYDTLPASLTETKLMTKSVVEEPEVQAARAGVVKSKSVAELSQITTISDFPVPETIENLFSNKTVDRKQYAPAERRKKIKEQQTKSKSTQSLSQGMYASLPRHFTMELAVKTVEQEPDLVAERRELLASKSVSELSQVKSLAEFPVPDVVQRVFHKSVGSLGGSKPAQDPSKSSAASSRPPTSLSGKGLQAEIYASLPRSLTEQQLLVRTKVEESAEVLQARQALVESKSPLELSEIHSLAEMPIPSRIEAWLHGEANGTQEGIGGDSPLAMPRNTKELGEALYRGLPSSLTAPVVVRSKVEDPTVLIERQQLQQTKSIHELSKIRNLNELPIPGNVIRMPDVPLPKMKSILNVIARPAPRSSPRRTPKSETYKSIDPESGTVESTPLMDERQLHSPDCPSEDRYEEISTSRTEEMDDLPSPPPPVEEEVEEEEEDQFSLADQIRATPERSLKKEKKKKNRRSTDSEALSADSGRMEEDEIPPPLPPKRITPSPKKGLSLETQPSLEEEEEAVPVKNSQGEQPQALRREKQSQPREMTEKATPDPVQSRPLPNPPAPPRLKKNKSVDSEGRSSRASGTGSPSCYRDAADATYTETANFQSCKDTLHTNVSKTLVDSANRPHSSLSDVTLADSCVDSLVSCAETLVGDSDPNLETCAETLRDENQTEFFSDDDLDNPYPAVDFDPSSGQGPGAGAQIIDRPGRSNVKKSESGRRLQEGTEQLSMELMEHVESLKTTLDNMSSRLGTRSRSRSHSKTRHSSQYRPSEQ